MIYLTISKDYILIHQFCQGKAVLLLGKTGGFIHQIRF